MKHSKCFQVLVEHSAIESYLINMTQPLVANDSSISSSFTWSNTIQGGAYWYHLDELAEGSYFNEYDVNYLYTHYPEHFI